MSKLTRMARSKENGLAKNLLNSLVALRLTSDEDVVSELSYLQNCLEKNHIFSYVESGKAHEKWFTRLFDLCHSKSLSSSIKSAATSLLETTVETSSSLVVETYISKLVEIVGHLLKESEDETVRLGGMHLMRAFLCHFSYFQQDSKKTVISSFKRLVPLVILGLQVHENEVLMIAAFQLLKEFRHYPEHLRSFAAKIEDSCVALFSVQDVTDGILQEAASCISDLLLCALTSEVWQCTLDRATTSLHLLLDDYIVGKNHGAYTKNNGTHQMFNLPKIKLMDLKCNGTPIVLSRFKGLMMTLLSTLQQTMMPSKEKLPSLSYTLMDYIILLVERCLLLSFNGTGKQTALSSDGVVLPETCSYSLLPEIQKLALKLLCSCFLRCGSIVSLRYSTRAIHMIVASLEMETLSTRLEAYQCVVSLARTLAPGAMETFVLPCLTCIEKDLDLLFSPKPPVKSSTCSGNNNNVMKKGMKRKRAQLGFTHLVDSPMEQPNRSIVQYHEQGSLGAVSALGALLLASGALWPLNLRQKHAHLLLQALEKLCTETIRMYQLEIKMALLASLIAHVQIPMKNGAQPYYLAECLKRFTDGIVDTHPFVAQQCSQAVAFCEIYLHPRAPPLSLPTIAHQYEPILQDITTTTSSSTTYEEQMVYQNKDNNEDWSEEEIDVNNNNNNENNSSLSSQNAKPKDLNTKLETITNTNTFKQEQENDSSSSSEDEKENESDESDEPNVSSNATSISVDPLNKETKLLSQEDHPTRSEKNNMEKQQKENEDDDEFPDIIDGGCTSDSD